jgi:hypothetical protein
MLLLTGSASSKEQFENKEETESSTAAAGREE